MNSCTFAGRLGQDPRLTTLDSGQTVCNLSLAVDRYKKDDGPLWLDVSVWGKTAENVAKYLRKGSEAVVTGEVDLRQYTKNDGSQGASVTVNAQRVTFVGGKADSAPSDVPVSAADFAPAASVSGSDDIPF